jgi:hypothetical protein
MIRVCDIFTVVALKGCGCAAGLRITGNQENRVQDVRVSGNQANQDCQRLLVTFYPDTCCLIT